MLNLEITSSGTAFIAGLVTSLHCAAMCGPISCLMLPAKGTPQGDPMVTSTLYHGGRMLAYSLLGLLAGGAGGQVLGLLRSDLLRWVPWLLVLFFIGLAFSWEKRLPRIPLIGRLSRTLHTTLQTRPRWQAGLCLGLATPLLPCGPLYFTLGASMLSGSALRGLDFMLCFALGTVPLLWFAQSQFARFQAKLGSLRLRQLRIAVALLAAALIAWRLRSTLGFDGPAVNDFVNCF